MTPASAGHDGRAGHVTSAGNTGIPRHSPNLRPPRMSRSYPAPSLVGSLIASLWLGCAAMPAHAELSANVMADVHALAQKEQQPLLDTLRDLVSIESGSKDVEGLNQIAQRVAGQLKQLGGTVEILEPTDVYRLDDTPEKIGPAVHAVFKGTGSKKIMLIAHMDTVYLKGMLKDQPFRIDGDKAYGLGIADDKQGVALILHTVALLQKLSFRDYGTLTVLTNGDEEISSPGWRSTITRFAADQDVVFSFEGGGTDGTLRLATSGIGSAYLTVQGKSSHAGSRPEGGVNALYELSHQLLQMKDLSKPEQGLKLNWTVSKAGTNRNVIPAEATAQADARALKVADFDELEKTLQEKIKNHLLPESKVELKFEVRRPPLEANDASRRVAAHGKTIYEEIGLPLKVDEKATGGGTDAAFAALKTSGAVVEGMGLSGFGAHSNDAEYVQLNSIVPRLYLTTRMIMDLSTGKLK
ncbi:glutamate carboxypeptidase [Bradyrhizobium canariense]|uniref:Glutamate carboxypeptidase n=2 Tax=Bradyrhizobium canariense TaxID=255045 RepID=A0A1X3FB48_9BRAD|nr:glutamate carboxypeptidase [Bradyrhizobium canariense]OSI73715.1 glutamate carboxypeptidase [Bradyrhizobium canariense]OSI83036.1 glutamate carboxypeptidase [Bradyrhizobium canariense]OSI85074.1 glutamate carboxypeptidase [Bradyrhizobium canariense]OSI97893.1 glutamate carboxypeptidase [Bradyrhizobium canariense]